MRALLFVLVLAITVMIGGKVFSRKPAPPVQVAATSAPAHAQPERAPRHSAPANQWTLSDEGLGPVRIGETPERIGTDLREAFLPVGKDAIACVTADWPSQPEGVTVSMSGGKVEQVTLGPDSKVRTDLGIGIGDDREDLIQRAKAAGREVRGESDGPRHTNYVLVLSSSPSDPPKALAFWAHDGKVHLIRAGFAYEIDREPCK
jgi:hypothetical protein